MSQANTKLYKFKSAHEYVGACMPTLLHTKCCNDECVVLFW